MNANRIKWEHIKSRFSSIWVFLFALLFLAVSGVVAEAAVKRVTNERSLEGRHRLELRFGYWDSGQTFHETAIGPRMEVKTRVEDLLGAFSYSYWVHDQVSTDITAAALVVEAISAESLFGISESATVVTSLMFGIRLYPVSSSVTPLRPYLSAGVGPYLGIRSEREVDYKVVQTTKTLGTFGGYVGGGVDIQMGRHLMAGVHVGYNVMNDFPEPVGLDHNFDGVSVSAGLSVLFGSGSNR